jgi:hypothetical protein
MRVPDDLRDCVCFITTWRAGSQTGIGTGFFVGMEIGVQDRYLYYLVTAKHCLFDDAGCPDEVVVLVNTSDGQIAELRSAASQWVEHPTSDVAILPCVPDTSRYKYRVYPCSRSATKDFVALKEVGPGDEVFVPGLLVHHPGRSRIMPIVRLGSIAAMPEDPVRLSIGRYPGAQEVHEVVVLLEVRSIGGLSGSPVYLHLPFWRELPEAGKVLTSSGPATSSSGGENWLLGVMHGFYPVGENDPDNVSGGNENLNTGIAVVIPVDRVMELINDPLQINHRDEMKHHIESGTSPSATSEAPDPLPYGAEDGI